MDWRKRKHKRVRSRSKARGEVIWVEKESVLKIWIFFGFFFFIDKFHSPTVIEEVSNEEQD